MAILLILALLDNESLCEAYTSIFGKYSPPLEMNSVRGVVIDKGGDPLDGCSVIIKGTSSNTMTGICGEFTLPVEQQEFTIIFQSISYEDQRTFELRLSAGEVANETIVFQIGRSKLKNKACKKVPQKRLKKFVIE